MSYYSKIVSIIEKVDDLSSAGGGEIDGGPAMSPASGEEEFGKVAKTPSRNATPQSVLSPSPIPPPRQTSGTATPFGAPDLTISDIAAANAARHRGLLQDYYNLDQSKLTDAQRQALANEDEDAFVVATEIAERVLEAEVHRQRELLKEKQRELEREKEREREEREHHQQAEEQSADAANTVVQSLKSSTSSVPLDFKSTKRTASSVVAEVQVRTDSPQTSSTATVNLAALIASSDAPTKLLATQLGEALTRIDSLQRNADQSAQIANLQERLYQRDALLERLRRGWEAVVNEAEATGDPNVSAVHEMQAELEAHHDAVASTEPLQRLQAMLATNITTIESLERSNASLRAQLKHEEATREAELAALKEKIESATFDSLKFSEVLEESARRKTELGRLSRKITTLQQLLDEKSAACSGYQSQAEALQQLLQQHRRSGYQLAAGETVGAAAGSSSADGTAVIDLSGAMPSDGNNDLNTMTSLQIHHSKVYQSLEKVRFGKNLQQGMTTIDHATVFVGRFLRRHAYARMFIAVYVLVIHLYLFGAVYSGLHSLPVDGHNLEDHISHHIDHHHIMGKD